MIRLMREGKSASEALQAVGLNARLEYVKRPSVELHPIEENSLMSGTAHYGVCDEQSSKNT